MTFGWHSIGLIAIWLECINFFRLTKKKWKSAREMKTSGPDVHSWINEWNWNIQKKIWKISLQVPFRHFLGNIGTLGRGMRYHLPNSSKSVPRISSKLLHISYLIHSYYCHVTRLTSPPGGTRVSFFFKFTEKSLEKMLKLEMNSVELLFCRVQLTGVDGVGG